MAMGESANHDAPPPLAENVKVTFAFFFFVFTRLLGCEPIEVSGGGVAVTIT